MITPLEAVKSFFLDNKRRPEEKIPGRALTNYLFDLYEIKKVLIVNYDYSYYDFFIGHVISSLSETLAFVSKYYIDSMLEWDKEDVELCKLIQLAIYEEHVKLIKNNELAVTWTEYSRIIRVDLKHARINKR